MKNVIFHQYMVARIYSHDYNSNFLFKTNYKHTKTQDY